MDIGYTTYPPTTISCFLLRPGTEFQVSICTLAAAEHIATSINPPCQRWCVILLCATGAAGTTDMCSTYNSSWLLYDSPGRLYHVARHFPRLCGMATCTTLIRRQQGSAVGESTGSAENRLFSFHVMCFVHQL
jgi:hypothetical protein